MIEKLEEILEINVVDGRLEFIIKQAGSIVFKHIKSKKESVDYISNLSSKLNIKDDFNKKACPITRIRPFPL